MAHKTPRHSILVPVDFSRYSTAALDFASSLAIKLEMPLVVLHVVHDPGDSPGFYASKLGKKKLGKLTDVAGDMMDRYIEKTSRKFQQIKEADVHRLLVSGIPVTRILEVIAKYKPKMVVMGSQGRTQLAQMLLGGKAAQVVRLSPVPVTIVKAKARHQ